MSLTHRFAFTLLLAMVGAAVLSMCTNRRFNLCEPDPCFSSDCPGYPGAETCGATNPPGNGEPPVVPDERSCATGCDGDVPHCDESRNVCVACLDASHCPPARNICDEEGAQGRVLACVACLSSADCTDPAAARCAAGLCDTCNADADCAHLSATPRCEATSGRCVECTPDTEARSCANAELPGEPKHTTCIDFTCSDTQPRSRNTCQSCNADNECKDGFFCVPMSFNSESLGNFCLRLLTPAAPGCASSERPFNFGLTNLTSVDGTNGNFCGPETPATTCPGARSFKRPCCKGPLNALGECPPGLTPSLEEMRDTENTFNLCGATSELDALCLLPALAADEPENYLCSPRCGVAATCSTNGALGGACSEEVTGVTGNFCSFTPPTS